MVPASGAKNARAPQVSDVGAITERKSLFIVCLMLALVAAVVPEMTYRWYYYHPDVARTTQLLGPMVFVAFTIATYYYSGRNKWMLLLWVLAPLCFLRIALFAITGLLWSLRGGMV